MAIVCDETILSWASDGDGGPWAWKLGGVATLKKTPNQPGTNKYHCTAKSTDIYPKLSKMHLKFIIADASVVPMSHISY